MVGGEDKIGKNHDTFHSLLLMFLIFFVESGPLGGRLSDYAKQIVIIHVELHFSVIFLLVCFFCRIEYRNLTPQRRCDTWRPLSP